MLALAPHATALDKQGAAHGGTVAGSTDGTALSGSVLLGSAIYNTTYAARPDNTGLALLRLAAHADLDLIGRRLSLPFDVNLFSDRRASGAKRLLPSELDLIGGVTSTWALGPGALEIGTRAERDARVTRGDEQPPPGAPLAQSYVDVRARYLLPLVDGPAFGLVATGTGGWFALNQTYAARPDNSGLALFRYALHLDASLPEQRLVASIDATSFTDRQGDGVSPTELDATVDVGWEVRPFALHLAFERDMPIDRGSYVQELVFAYATWAFEAWSGG